MLTQTFLRECLSYEPLTGEFTWLTRPQNHFTSDSSAKLWNAKLAGKRAGSPHNRGYWFISVAGKFYLAHRLAFLWMTGEMPKEVDHINGDKRDNRWDNLRPADRTINCRNHKLHKNNTTGVCGVTFNKQQRRYQAQIHIEGRNITIGFFENINEAASARQAANIIYGFSPRHGALPAGEQK